MSKAPDAFRTISEVADWLETPAHVLRFWESKFSQVKPVKRAGGRRYYRPNDMLLLGGIKRLLHQDGLTIKGVQKMLRDKGVKHVSSLSLHEIGEDIPEIEQTIDHQQNELEDIAPQPEATPVGFNPAPQAETASNVVPIAPDNNQMTFPGFDHSEANEAPTPEADPQPAPEPAVFACHTEPSPPPPETEETKSIDISALPDLPDLEAVKVEPGILSKFSKLKLGALDAQIDDVKGAASKLALILSARQDSNKT